MKFANLAQYLAIQVTAIGDRVDAAKLPADSVIQLHVERALAELAAATVYLMRPATVAHGDHARRAEWMRVGTETDHGNMHACQGDY